MQVEAIDGGEVAKLPHQIESLHRRRCVLRHEFRHWYGFTWLSCEASSDAETLYGQFDQNSTSAGGAAEGSQLRPEGAASIAKHGVVVERAT